MNVTASSSVKNSTMKTIIDAARVDTETTLLTKAITSGWPSVKTKLPPELRAFWKFKSDLTVDNGLIFKGSAVFIPRPLRQEMLKRAHASHYNAVASWRGTRDCIFWPTLKGELTEFCENCESCSAYQPHQPKEPLMITTNATYPFQIVYQDFFSLNGRQYLVTVDVYSDFFEVDDFGNNTTADRLVQATQKHFARYGTPVELHSDNGSQFTSEIFTDFLTSWGVSHVTSSPYFPQGNGKAEAAVKVAKRLMKKCQRSGEDFTYALLALRNTVQSDGSSRAQKFFSRSLRSRLPSRLDSDFVFDKSQVRKNVQKRLHRKKHFDRRTRPLRRLGPGSLVRVQPLSRDGRWSKGACVREVAPRSYRVRLEDGTMVRRNRKHLREVPSKRDVATDPSTAKTESDNSSSGRKRRTPDDRTIELQTPRRSDRIKKPRIIYSPE